MASSSIARAALRRNALLVRSAASPLGLRHRPAAANVVLGMRLSVLSPSPHTLLLRGLSTASKPTNNAPKPFSISTNNAAPPAAAEATHEEAEDVRREGTRSIVHFKLSPNRHPLRVVKLDPAEKTWENPMGHSVWTKAEVDGVKITHLAAEDWTAKVAYGIAQTLRFSFDLLAGFKTRRATEEMYLNRVVFLETVAGIPGMCAGMIRHMHSLRRMKRDGGWIHTLLEEAENERMHLLTFLRLKQPGPLFRTAVLVTQAAFFNVFFFAYLINPRICHRLVGYIEEEAVKTYTHIIEEMDAGNLPLFNHIVPPPIAISYWKLAPDASFRDLLLAIRKDEDTHREVNHTFASMEEDDYNPFVANAKYHAQVTEVKEKGKGEGGK